MSLKYVREGMTYRGSIVLIMNLKPSLSTALYGRRSFAMKQVMDFVIFFARSQLCGSFSKW